MVLHVNVLLETPTLESKQIFLQYDLSFACVCACVRVPGLGGQALVVILNLLPAEYS